MLFESFGTASTLYAYNLWHTVNVAVPHISPSAAAKRGAPWRPKRDEGTGFDVSAATNAARTEQKQAVTCAIRGTRYLEGHNTIILLL